MGCCQLDHVLLSAGAGLPTEHRRLPPATGMAVQVGLPSLPRLTPESWPGRGWMNCALATPTRQPASRPVPGRPCLSPSPLHALPASQGQLQDWRHTRVQPAVGPQMKQLQPGQLLKFPPMCPPVAARIFFACTQLQPAQRPSALDIVQWLREDAEA